MSITVVHGKIIAEIENFHEFSSPWEQTNIIQNNLWVLSVDVLKMEGVEYLSMGLMYEDKFSCELWSSDATVRFVVINKQGNNKEICKRASFKAGRQIVKHGKDFLKLDDAKENYMEDNKLKLLVEISLHENTTKGFRAFDTPEEYLTDVVLLVEGKKVHVGKQALAMHSQYFYSLFFGEFEEKTKDEIEIKDVIYADFIELLNMVFPSPLKYDDYNVFSMVQLSSRFQLTKILESAETYLLRESGIPTVYKLFLSDRFNLPNVLDTVLESWKTSGEIVKVMKMTEFKALGDGMIRIIDTKRGKMLSEEYMRNNENSVAGSRTYANVLKGQDSDD